MDEMVEAGQGCPTCGEGRVDELEIMDQDGPFIVHCLICGKMYSIS
jgi:transcription elongation factor Elf1